MKTEKDCEFVRGEFPFIGGGTDAEKMLRLTFALLDNGEDHYMNADVLWITEEDAEKTIAIMNKEYNQKKLLWNSY